MAVAMAPLPYTAVHLENIRADHNSYTKKNKTDLCVAPAVHLQGTKRAKTWKSGLNGSQPYGNYANISKAKELGRYVRNLCAQGRLKEALHILDVMDHQGIRADPSIYASLLQECANQKTLPEGKLVHAHLINTGLNVDIFLGNRLVIMYAKCSSLADARRVFDEMPRRDAVSWTAMIAGYARHGYQEEALALFCEMRRAGAKPNQFTFTRVLPACAKLADLQHGRRIHGDIINRGFQSNVCVANALLDMYAKCGRVEDARHVFDKMPQRDAVSWHSMIAGYARNGCVEEALKLFQTMPERGVLSWTVMIAAYARHGHGEEGLALFYQMQRTCIRPNQFTFASVLPACANLAAVKKIHKDIISCGFQSDIVVASALVDMYAKCGSMENARDVFDKMFERNMVSWNAIIWGYAQNGCADEAVKLFQKMPEREAVSWNTIIAGYAQNGHTGEALKLFQKIPKKDVVSWNTMIAGYVQNGQFNEALPFFRQMQLTSVKPNLVTFVSVLPACGNLALLKNGKEAHAKVIRSGFEFDISVGSALVDMYAKCGAIEDASEVFAKMPEQNVVSWTAMILGYAINGCGKEALQLFEQMEQTGTKPNHITFIGVLSACCHAGLVDDGWQYFDCMRHNYHITPTVDHYCCMVDLLGRAGCLDEAQGFIHNMPIKPDAAVWGALLGACRIHNNVELGQWVAEQLLELEPENAAVYVVLSNIYAAAGKWSDVERMQKRMKDSRVIKSPGCSWIEVNNKVYSFLAGDKSHPQADKIYAELERLSGQTEAAGYVPEIS